MYFAQLAADALDRPLDSHPLVRRFAIVGGLLRDSLHPGLVVAELVLQIFARLFQGALARDVGGAALVSLELGVELLNDHRRAPRRLFLRAEHVAVDVIADVEDARARNAEQ